MLITADQLLAHGIGDYILQSHWMATEKTKQSFAALCHVVTYAVPFCLLRPSVWAMAAIVGTHFVIDRWRLARFLVWTKNWMGPKGSNEVWEACSGTGYKPDTPIWLAVWLLIIADNIMHITINGLALKYL